MPNTITSTIDAANIGMRAARVLVVDDESLDSGTLRRGLESENYRVDVVSHNSPNEYLIQTSEYDLVILNLSQSEQERGDLLQRLRINESAPPVLALTPQNLPAGTESAPMTAPVDYLAKPFAFEELSARARALVERRRHSQVLVLQVEDLVLHRVERRVTRGDRTIKLTSTEFALLECLMLNEGKPVSRAAIHSSVWKLNFQPDSNVVDVYVNYLRRKVDFPFASHLIRTVRGIGYSIEPPAPHAVRNVV